MDVLQESSLNARSLVTKTLQSSRRRRRRRRNIHRVISFLDFDLRKG